MAPRRGRAAAPLAAAAVAAVAANSNSNNNNGGGQNNSTSRRRSSRSRSTPRAAAAAAAAASRMIINNNNQDDDDLMDKKPAAVVKRRQQPQRASRSAAPKKFSTASSKPAKNNNNSNHTTTTKRRTASSVPVATTSSTSSSSGMVDFPDTIDPTIMLSSSSRKQQPGGGMGGQNIVVNDKDDDLKSTLFHPNNNNNGGTCGIAVETTLSRHQSTLWMSSLGAQAAARHALPELRKLGVVKRKLVFYPCPTPRPPPPSTSSSTAAAASRRKTSRKQRGGAAGATTTSSSSTTLAELFQQQKNTGEKEDKKKNQNVVPTLKTCKMSGMPKNPNGERLALESYLRHGECIPATKSAQKARSSKLLAELSQWHDGEVKNGPGFTSKRAWFDGRGQLLRLHHTAAAASENNNAPGTKSSNNKKKKKKGPPTRDDDDDDASLDTFVTTPSRLLDLVKRGFLQDSSTTDDDNNSNNLVVRVLQREIPVDTQTVLESLLELSLPEGAYSVPFVVSIPVLKKTSPSTPCTASTRTSPADGNLDCYELEIGVYCHRLLFECDYADDLLVIMSALDRDSYQVAEPLLPPPAKPAQPVFESDPSRTVNMDKSHRSHHRRHHDSSDSDDDLSCCSRDEQELSAFSKQGLLKLMESKGNDISAWPEIQRKLQQYFKVDLMLHQVHGVCWMLQMEAIRQKSPRHGLNALLWEVRRFGGNDGGGIYYYSPVLGQIRLHLEKSPFHEPQPVSGGLLCDQVGLGKTIEVLALVCATKDDDGDDGDASGQEANDDDDDDDDDVDMESCDKDGNESTDDDDEEEDEEVDHSQYSHHTTLVIVTPALVTQWFNEIKKATGDALVCEFFDHNTGEFEPRSSRDNKSEEQQRTRVDIVVTTYNAFGTGKSAKKRKRGKHPATILKSISWKRVCLDEMQEIRSDRSTISKQIENLQCDCRWMVSGSPLFEGLDDLRGELAFLRLVPFGANVEDGFWNYAIRQPFNDENPHAIELLLSLGQVLLRREKSTRVIGTGATILDLEKYSLEFVNVPQSEDERAVYCALEYVNHDLSEGKKATGKERDIIVRLLRLACTAPALLYPELKKINDLWKKIHQLTHAVRPQSAVLSCVEAIQYLSHIEDAGDGTAHRDRALLTGPTRAEVMEKLAKAKKEIKKWKSKRYKALWHKLLEKVTTGQYPFPENGQPVSNEWKTVWTCRGLILNGPRATAISNEMLMRGWRPGPSFCRTERENADMAELIRGLQTRVSPLPCYFSHLLTNPLCVYLTSIPRVVGKNELSGAFDALSHVLTNPVTILPLEPASTAQVWNAFVEFESQEDYDAFVLITKRKNGVEFAVASPIPWIEDSIKNARVTLSVAEMQYELNGTTQDGLKLVQAERALSDAMQGLRMFSKGHPRLEAAGHVMCISSKDFNLRKADRASQPEQELSTATNKLKEQTDIGQDQEKILAELDGDYSSESSTFDVLQNLRLGQGEDECSICRDVFLTKTQIKLTRCGHLLCDGCYRDYHIDRNEQHCIMCRKPVHHDETKNVDPQLREDPGEELRRRKQAEEQLEKASEEMKTTHGRLSAATWRSLYERLPRPDDSDRCSSASVSALPGDFLAHLRNATGIPVGSSNSSAAALVSNSSQYSSKIRALLEDLPKDERSVVFASSKEIIMLLRKVFDLEGIQHRALYTSQGERESGLAINEWQTIDSCRVLLVQAGAAACGLTLTAARKMFIIDPFQRHEEEKQAYARIHRIGQTQKVEIKVYYTPVSVEARLLDWRNRAGSENPDAETITNVLHGSKMDGEGGADDDEDDDDDQMEFLLGRENDMTEEESDSS